MPPRGRSSRMPSPCMPPGERVGSGNETKAGPIPPLSSEIEAR